jgi:hypothetical protein
LFYMDFTPKTHAQPSPVRPTHLANMIASQHARIQPSPAQPKARPNQTQSNPQTHGIHWNPMGSSGIPRDSRGFPMGFPWPHGNPMGPWESNGLMGIPWAHGNHMIPMYPSTWIYGDGSLYSEVFGYVGMHPQVLGHIGLHPEIPKYLGTWTCIPICPSTWVYGDASAYTRLPGSLGMYHHVPKYFGIWGCIPIYQSES